MKKIAIFSSAVIVLMLSMKACVEPFNPSVASEDLRYLVVDASLDTDGNAVVTLTRTLPLYSEETPPPELNASVAIEAEGGGMFPLPEVDYGVYAATIPVNINEKYRVRIQTTAEESYLSEYVPVLETPAIDSVYWTLEPDGIGIYVDTHDDENDSRYYKWDRIQTFAYTAAYASVYEHIDGEIVPRPLDEMVFQCWRTDSLKQIVIGATDHLEKDVVRAQEVMHIPYGSRTLSVVYSMLVRQRTITPEAYEYYRLLEKTTEELGGLFDPQPAQVTGNFYDATETNRRVIGYFVAGSVSEKRIYIARHELPEKLRIVPKYDCAYDTVLIQDLWLFDNLHLIGSVTAPGMPVVIGYTKSSKFCTDCRVQGGTNIKPDFWDP